MSRIGRPADMNRVELGLTALAITGDNATKASEATNIPHRTLCTWRTQHAERYQQIQRERAPQLEREIVNAARTFVLRAQQVELAALEATNTALPTLKDPSTALRNIATAKAINVDKMLLIDGRPTNITEKRTADQVLTGLTTAGYIDTTATQEPQPQNAVLALDSSQQGV